jgi:hypothetical protein
MEVPVTDTTEKVRENRLRRMAVRQGLELHKSRRRDPRAIDFGRYGITRDGEWIEGQPDRLTMTIDEVEKYLTQ